MAPRSVTAGSAPRVAMLAVLCLSACAHRSPPSSASGLADEVRPMVAEIVKLRGLAEKRPARVEWLDDGPFLDALGARARRLGHSETAFDERAFWVAFGFVQPEAPVAPGAVPASHDPEKVYGGLVDEQVLGFYDEGMGVLYVRKTVPASAANLEGSLRSVLSHELEHALQDQHFTMGNLTAIANPDERLARRALFEGDAMVVMSAVAAARRGQPVDAALAQAADLVRLLPVSALVQLSGHSPKLMNAPSIVREGLLFPYVSGMAFINDLYRTGGFALVDKVFARPPRTSEQIIHPQKYLDGEGAIEVTPPTPPPGWRVVAAGTMGELGARALLADCLSLREAQGSTVGWGGDSYVVVEGGDKALALLWSTAWDDAAAAGRFARSLREVPRCWKAPLADGGGAGYRITNDQVVLAQGTSVSFVRGLPFATLDGAAHALLLLPHARVPSQAPFGALTLEPAGSHKPRQAVAGARGRVDGRRYVNERLNVAALLPEKFDVQPDEGKAELQIIRQGSLLPGGLGRAVGVFATIRSALTPAVEEQYFTALAGAFTAGLTREQALHLDRQGDARVAFGKGREHVWSIDHSPTRLRATILPTCGGKALYVFAEVWSDGDGQRALTGWIDSFAPVHRGDGPWCAEKE